jgi:hypothetical protein
MTLQLLQPPVSFHTTNETFGLIGWRILFLPLEVHTVELVMSQAISISLTLSIYGSTALVVHGRFFSFLILYKIGWAGDQPVARPLPACRIIQTQNERTQTPLLLVGFELTIPVFEVTVHALDRAVTVTHTSLTHLLTTVAARSL